jgi:hypothetical protein
MRMSIGIGPFRFYSKQRYKRRRKTSWAQVFNQANELAEQNRRIKARKAQQAQQARIEQRSKPYNGPGWEQWEKQNEAG